MDLRMNKRQQLFILSLLSKLAMIGTFYFGFWTFIYEVAWWNKPLWLALMSSAVSLVLAVLCFLSWVVLDIWTKDPSTLPTFKIERAAKKKPEADDKERKPESDVEKKKKEERLPLF